ncbi:MAG: YSC84-related protein [Terriglobales bacterium]|jgi:lipid-binding SYLF domain-containing protein
MTIATLVAVLLMATVSAWAKDDTPDEKRADIRKDVAAVMKRLYKAEPHAKSAVAGAAGYAAFDNMGMNLLVVSTARGSGMAVDNKTKKETFMKMISGGVGLGAGIKDYCVIFLFENQQALARFIDSGWDASTQADAAAKSDTKGGAYSGASSVAPGVWVYQLTKKGLALQVTLQGTKYFKNGDLN